MVHDVALVEDGPVRRWVGVGVGRRGDYETGSCPAHEQALVGVDRQVVAL